MVALSRWVLARTFLRFLANKFSLQSILSRDVRDIAEVERLAELPKFVRLLAEHLGQLINYGHKPCAASLWGMISDVGAFPWVERSHLCRI